MNEFKNNKDNRKLNNKYYLKPKIIFIINILILIINLFYLNIYKENLDENNNILTLMNFDINKNNKLFKFKNSDYFNIDLLYRSFQEISNYMNSKYYSNLRLNNKKNKKKKKIKLKSVDLFDKKYHQQWLKNKLSNKFHIKFNSNKPDYLIFNVFGDKHLDPKYKNTVKIAIYTENVIPEMDYADYVIGHAHINYLDRYFKYNIFLWQNFENIDNIRQKVLNSPKRIKFCGAVISNINITDNFRIDFIKELNKYKKIDMGGKYNNNIGQAVVNKKEFLSSYKFSIAMENTNGDGYISEKIIDSFISGTIPIYYGDYMVDEYINPKSYILIKGVKDMKKKIDYIKLIDNNDKIYQNILKEKVIIDNNFVNTIDKELKLFLTNIFIQDKNKAFRVNS